MIKENVNAEATNPALCAELTASNAGRSDAKKLRAELAAVNKDRDKFKKALEVCKTEIEQLYDDMIKNGMEHTSSQK